ncbi:hypothetical protein [Streptomyces sp. NPDC001410]|uniref:hypothetical protein n=1 Tax=Streptomyces sp. NPDC001410 TaxID=3364574 RepID=UPI0036A76010
MGVINLVVSKDIAEAAHAIDEETWRFHIAVRRGLTPEESWLDLRGRAVAAQGNFIAVARRHLWLTGILGAQAELARKWCTALSDSAERCSMKPNREKWSAWSSRRTRISPHLS